MLNESVLRWMNDLAAQGIFMTDADLTIRGWNRWLEIHSGRSASEMIGQNLLVAYPELVDRLLDKYYKEALAGQVRLLSQRLHRYLLPMPSQIDTASFAFMQQSARIAPLLENEQVIGTITVIDDVTERIAYEAQLIHLFDRERSARKEAETANRAKDEFIATVSHELRTPLNAIAGWVQIIGKQGANSDSLSQGLESIERNVKAQTRIIEDILDISRIVTGKLKLDVAKVNLVPLIESSMDTVRLAADAKAISLHLMLGSQEILVSGDANRLQQVIWNLLSNAIKFTPKGGTVIVQLVVDEAQAEIQVSDNGKGIDAEFLPFVFDRFRQADSTSTRQHGGLGLGLAIVRHLVEIHGGTVRVTSPGENLGATFSISLPLLRTLDLAPVSIEKSEELSITEGTPLINMSEKSTNGNVRLDGRRVLIVDDDQDAREMLEILLTQRGAEIKISGSSQEALKVLTQWQPHVMVSDIGMPGEDGYSLIKQLRALESANGGGIPAIALTGYASPTDKQNLLAVGYQVHISKPVDVDLLIKAIAGLTGATPVV
jgi:signal transduction histidine kinase/ActR/RegA family two-component response regulator